MLKYNFTRIFKARGIDRPFTYLVKAGFSDKLATRIKNNRTARIELRELERLCLLLNCTPNDFYEWVPDPDTGADKDHALYTIRKTDKVFDLTRALNSVSLDDLEKLETLINENINPGSADKE